MKKPLLVVLFLLCASQVRAQLYVDVTQSPYNADSSCQLNAGPAINAAITNILNYPSATNSPNASGSTLYFPPGCYLINTQIIEPGILSTGNGNGLGIAYLGFGRVQLQAGNQLTGSIIQFGTAAHSPSHRLISNIFFNCNAVANVDAIDIAGLVNSEFDNIEIRDCSSYAIRSIGTGSLNYSNIFEGGAIGISSGMNLPNANGIAISNESNSWTFKGTYISYSGSIPSTGIGMDIENSAGVTCVGCTIQGWNIGLAAGHVSNVYGLEVSGGYFESNQTSAISLGNYSSASEKVFGASIHGVYINGNNIEPVCIDLSQVSSFSLVDNEFNQCANITVRALADVNNPPNTFQGADNGVVGPNDSSSSAGSYQLLGTNIHLIAPACVSSASPASCGYTASGTVALPAGGNNLIVNAPFVSANSRILIAEDMSLSTELGIICNTVGGRTYSVTSKTPGVGFTITSSTAPNTNPACLVFSFQN